MKDGKKAQSWGAHVTLRNIQEVQASKLGYAQGIPMFINKTSGHFTVLYFYCSIYYVLFLEHRLFLFSVQFSLLAIVFGWIPTFFVLERDTLRFHCLEHSSFHSRCCVSVHFCQYYVQLLFSTLMLFRACQFSTLVNLLVRFPVVRLLVSLRKFLLKTCFK